MTFIDTKAYNLHCVEKLSLIKHTAHIQTSLEGT